MVYLHYFSFQQCSNQRNIEVLQLSGVTFFLSFFLSFSATYFTAKTFPRCKSSRQAQSAILVRNLPVLVNFGNDQLQDPLCLCVFHIEVRITMRNESQGFVLCVRHCRF